MRHYYHATSTRGHGLAVVIWAIPFLSLCGYGFHLALSPESDSDSRNILVLLAVGSLTAAGILFLAVALRHIFSPQEAFVEITETELRWRDWNLFGMRVNSFQLAAIQAVKLPYGDDALPFLEIHNSGTMTLPTLVIPNQKDFNAALKQAAPHIAIDDRF